MNIQLNVKPYSMSILLALILTACIASPKTSDSLSNTNINNSSTTGTADARVPLGDGRVSFVPPRDLKPLTKDQIAASKFAKSKPPHHVFTNDNQTVHVAITFSFMDLAPDQLSEYKEALVRFSKLDSDLQLLECDIAVINGRKWVHLEAANAEPDVDVHYHSYTTSLDGGALVFAFTSTVRVYPQVKDEFLRSAQTIQVKD